MCSFFFFVQTTHIPFCLSIDIVQVFFTQAEVESSMAHESSLSPSIPPEQTAVSSAIMEHPVVPQR